MGASCPYVRLVVRFGGHATHFLSIVHGSGSSQVIRKTQSRNEGSSSYNRSRDLIQFEPRITQCPRKERDACHSSDSNEGHMRSILRW